MKRMDQRPADPVTISLAIQTELRPQRSVIAKIVADEAPELSRRLCRPQSGEHSAVEIEHACLPGEFRAGSRRKKSHLIVVLIPRKVRTDLRRMLWQLQSRFRQRREDRIGGIIFGRLKSPSAAMIGVKA